MGKQKIKMLTVKHQKLGELLFGGPEPTHRILGNMADKYGPIFTMKMGVNRALVVSNSEITKECFTTNDKALASRPRRMAMEI